MGRLGVIAFTGACALSLDVTCIGIATACPGYGLFQVSDAVKNATPAPASVKARSCMWGGAAIEESGGSLCAHNSNNYGVLQLSRANIASLGLTPQQYMSETLQEQVDGWAIAGATNNNASIGFQLIDGDIGKTLKFGQVMEGILAACSQFGPVVCNNDIKLIESGKALPLQPLGSPGAIRCKTANCNNGTANQDGNGHTIHSWGLNIQVKINESQCVD
jgi:hypothetical protein